MAALPVVTLPFLDTDPQSLVASVIAAQPSSTVYLVNCPDPSSDDCGTYDETITIQPASVPSPTYDVYAANPDAPADTASGFSFHCALTSSSGYAVPTSCDAISAGSSMPITGSELSGMWGLQAVTITAGAEKLMTSPSAVVATPTATTASDSVFEVTGTVTPTAQPGVVSGVTPAATTGAAVSARAMDAGVGGVALLGLLLARFLA